MDINQSKKDTNITETSQNKGIETEIFAGKDKTVYFVYMKIKKIVAAIFLITANLNESDTVRVSLRQWGTELIQAVSLLHLDSPLLYRKFKDESKTFLLRIGSLLDVASFSGLISPMNNAILKDEINGVAERMDALKSDKEMFVEELRSGFKVSELMSTGKSLSRAEEANLSLSNDEILKDKSRVLDEISTDSLSSSEENRRRIREFSPVAVKRNRRQTAIIGVLKKKREIIIKDLAGIISDCSEKTIQRELLNLVQAGILTKKGIRRSTKYSLTR